MLISNMMSFFETLVSKAVESYVKLRVKLRPNCLLTRYPIVLVRSKKNNIIQKISFNFSKHFLIQHGYQIKELSLSHQEDVQSKQLQEFLKNHKFSQKFHFIRMDEKINLNAHSAKNPQDLLNHAIRLAERDFISAHL